MTNPKLFSGWHGTQKIQTGKIKAINVLFDAPHLKGQKKKVSEWKQLRFAGLTSIKKSHHPVVIFPVWISARKISFACQEQNWVFPGFSACVQQNMVYRVFISGEATKNPKRPDSFCHENGIFRGDIKNREEQNYIFVGSDPALRAAQQKNLGGLTT